MARLGMLAILLAIALASGTVPEGASAAAPPNPRAAGTDSPWPPTNDLRQNLGAVRKEIDKLAFQVELMEESVARYDDWETCLSYVPVSEYGDPWNSAFGYLYDERDGTGVGFMDALSLDPFSRPGKEHYMFIDFARSQSCRSAAPLPGGTAEPASIQSWRDASDRVPLRAKGRRALKGELRRQERRATNLFRRSQRLEAASERFDEWESCVSWVPVTEQGSADGTFGYLFGAVGSEPGYRTALHIDRSDWDDPDYMFLALVGGDRPGRTCQDEPGEAVD
jgi:hypothetical protein